MVVIYLFVLAVVLFLVIERKKLFPKPSKHKGNEGGNSSPHSEERQSMTKNELDKTISDWQEKLEEENSWLGPRPL